MSDGRAAARLLDQERELHQRIMDRDESGLLEFLDRSGHVVYCAALVRTGDLSVADELTEGLFVELWQRPEAFDPAHGPLALQLLERMAEARWEAELEAGVTSGAGPTRPGSGFSPMRSTHR